MQYTNIGLFPPHTQQSITLEQINTRNFVTEQSERRATVTELTPINKIILDSATLYASITDGLL